MLFDVLRTMMPRAQFRGLVLGILSVLITRYLLIKPARKRRLLTPSRNHALCSAGTGSGDDVDEGVLDLRRKAQIGWGKATDHAGEVVIVPAQGFDMNRTIFGNLTGVLPRMVMRAKIAVDLYWSDHATTRIERAFATVPTAPNHNQGKRVVV